MKAICKTKDSLSGIFTVILTNKNLPAIAGIYNQSVKYKLTNSNHYKAIFWYTIEVETEVQFMNT
jgi:hypothetical protein